MMNQMSNTFKVAVIMILLMLIYMGVISFVSDANVNAIFANRIITFFQNVIMILVGYYWGTSTKTGGIAVPSPDSSNVTTETTEKVTTIEATEPLKAGASTK